jgi:Tfp pilus assembly protein PilF
MGMSRFVSRAAIVLIAFSSSGLSGCASISNMIASTKSADKPAESRNAWWAKRTGDASSQSAFVPKSKSTPLTEVSQPVTDETRTHVALAMGEMLEGSGQLSVAAERYEQALKLDPKSLKASLALARVYNRMGRPDAALKVYEAAERHHRKEPALFNDKALLLAEQNQLTAAVDLLRQATKLDKSNSRYHNNLGMVLALAGEYDEAWKEFREAVGPAPAHFNVATMLMKAGRTQDARDHLERAVAIMPSLKEAQTLLAQMSEKPAAPAPAPQQPEVGIVNAPKVTINSIFSNVPAAEEIQPVSVDSPTDALDVAAPHEITPVPQPEAPSHQNPWERPHVAPKWLR